MRIVVVGGIGVVGCCIVEVVCVGGYDLIVFSCLYGVDFVMGCGLVEVLDGVDVVIDVVSIEMLKVSIVIEFFIVVMGFFFVMVVDVGVGYIVVLLIVGIDWIFYDYYVGKIV